jgi:hypothetical protein
MFVVFYKFYILIIEDNTRLIGCLVSRKNNTFCGTLHYFLTQYFKVEHWLFFDTVCLSGTRHYFLKQYLKVEHYTIFWHSILTWNTTLFSNTVFLSGTLRYFLIQYSKVEHYTIFWYSILKWNTTLFSDTVF